MKKLLYIVLVFIFNGVCPDDSYISFEEPIQVLNLVKQYLPENPIIVEAGAFDGNDSIAMAHYWPKATIYSFEPVPDIYQKLKNNTKDIPIIHTYPLAIGQATEIKPMYISEHPDQPSVSSQSSSLLEPKEHLQYAPIIFPTMINVAVTTFDAWAHENNVDYVDFMWLDMQGYELNALKASPKILSTVRVILTEVEFVEAYKDQFLFQDVKKWLESQGFTLIARSTCYGWFGDALFVRNELIK